MVDYKRLYEDMPAPRFQVERIADKRFLMSFPNLRAAQFFGDLTLEEGASWDVNALLIESDYRAFIKAYDICLSTRAGVPITMQPQALLPSGEVRSPRPFMLYPVLNRKGRPTSVDVVGNTHMVRHTNLQEERDDALVMMGSVFDMSEVGIVITDEAHKIIRVNNAVVRNFGWDEDALIGQQITGFVTPDVRQALIGQQSKLASSSADDGQRSSGELRVIRHDGSIANVLFTASVMHLSGERAYQVYTLMDITLRKRMEETLRAAKERADSASHAKSVFLANMSHELRTPLNAIMGFSEIMLEGTFGAIDNDRYHDYLRDIHDSAAHLLGIINEVLDMSKVEAGKIILDESNFAPAALFEEARRMMESRAFSKDVHFKTDYGDDVPQLRADKRILKQVFINLLMNAIKFSNEGGAIDISIQRCADDGALEFCVRDYGIGIAADKIDRILEPFGQAHESDEYAPQEGTGLGLPLARAMVDLHQGSLRIESEEGKGTCVYVRLPAVRVVEGSKKEVL